MKDYTKIHPDRKMRVWWYADTDSHTVSQVQGFECSPGQSGMWWCPEAGYSMSEAHHLFKSAEEAKAHVLAEAKLELKALQTAIAKLETT